MISANEQPISTRWKLIDKDSMGNQLIMTTLFPLASEQHWNWNQYNLKDHLCCGYCVKITIVFGKLNGWSTFFRYKSKIQLLWNGSINYMNPSLAAVKSFLVASLFLLTGISDKTFWTCDAELNLYVCHLFQHCLVQTVWRCFSCSLNFMLLLAQPINE